MYTEVGKNLVLYYLFSGKSSNVFHNEKKSESLGSPRIKRAHTKLLKTLCTTKRYNTFEVVRYLYTKWNIEN